MFSLLFSATIVIAITYLGITGLADRRDMWPCGSTSRTGGRARPQHQMRRRQSLARQGRDAIIVLREFGPRQDELPPAVPISAADTAKFKADNSVISGVYASPVQRQSVQASRRIRRNRLINDHW
jgi:hypothetical protein